MFYILRFLLGICEAGFFPGVILYFNFWLPSHRQSLPMSLFVIGIPLSLSFGSILSGWLMEITHGAMGFNGWQWMLLIEGLPAVVLGLVVYLWLNDGIDSAKWLSPDERVLLRDNLDSENHKKKGRIRDAIRNPYVWLLSGIELAFSTGFYGLVFWLPSIIKASGVQNPLDIGFLAAIPYLVAVITMVSIGAIQTGREGVVAVVFQLPVRLAEGSY